MIRQITDDSQLRQAQHLRRRVTDGQTDLSAAWIEESQAKVLAQESGRHLEADEAVALAEACGNAEIGPLVAIGNDPLVTDDVAYLLDATTEDLTAISFELAGINCALTDEAGSLCVLFTTDDFKLVAGPLEFVASYAGDLLAAKRDFLAFSQDHLEGLRLTLRKAAAYMDWIEGD